MKKLRLLYFVALLLMVAVGAKADDRLNITSNDIGKILCTDGTLYATATAAEDDGKRPVAMIAYVDGLSHKGLAIALDDAYVINDGHYSGSCAWTEIDYYLQTWVTENDKNVPNATWKVPSPIEWQQMLIGCGALGDVEENNFGSVYLTIEGINTFLINGSGNYSALEYSFWSDTEYDNEKAWYAYFNPESGKMDLSGYSKSMEFNVRGCLSFKIAADVTYPIKCGGDGNGTIQADETEAAAGETVTLTATPAPGYMLENIVVTDKDSNPVEVVGGTWYTYGNNNEATFIMPESQVTVMATFTHAKTAADGLFMRMPTDDELICTIPDGVFSFKIKGDGYYDGDITHNRICNGTLVLKSTTNHIFQLDCKPSRGMNTSWKSDFYVYDGTSQSASVIAYWVKGQGSYNGYTIPESGLVQSTTPNMTIHYWSNVTADAVPWFNMTVNVAATYISSMTAIITSESQVTLPSLNVDYGLSAPGSGAGDATIDGEKANLYTLCLPYTPIVSEGMKFYTLDSSTESSLKFMEITGSPAANTPYLVAVFSDKNVGQNINAPVTLEKEIDKGAAIEGFKFLGTTTGIANAEAAAKNAFILQDGNTWGRVPDGHPEVYIPPFRAYIVPTAATGRSVLVGSFGDATGITTLQLTDRDGTTRYFDLNGRRISNPAAKGVYVTNGKKVIIK